MWTFLYIFSSWVIRIVMLFVVTRKRKPVSALAWLMIIAFQPHVGLVLYLLFGSNHLPNRRILRNAQLREQLKELDKATHALQHVVNPDALPEFRHTAKLSQALCELPLVSGNEAELLINTDDTVARMVQDIDAAKRSVHLLFFIYAPDESGRAVGEALKRATQRGVPCRVLADAVGSKAFFKKLAPELRAAGVEVHEVLPVGVFRSLVHRMDLRTHRKIAVIDGTIAYTGSQNLINADYGEKGQKFFDLMMRLVGPVALELQVVFMEDWYFETHELLNSQDAWPTEMDPAGDILAQTLPSGPNYPTENYQQLVISALELAEREVTITTPYFVPDMPLFEALQTSAIRGVHVQLIVPKKSNHPLCDAAGHSFFEDLLACGVDIQQFESGTLHTKSVRIDDSLAFIGSSNFDIRSFALNFEINMLLYGPEIAGKLKAIHNEYLEHSSGLTLEEWRQRPAWREALCNIAKLLSPLL